MCVCIVFEIWCVFYTYSTTQVRLTTYQVLNSSMWLVATILDNAGLECLAY